MYPYIELFGIGFNMTGVGCIFALLTFISTIGYLCKKYHKSFLKIFYFLPWIIIITYFLGGYVQFMLDGNIIPMNLDDIYTILSPEHYNFHFVGILIGLVISFYLFFKTIPRKEDKKIWVDIIFTSIAIAFIPLGIGLLFGDSFIGKPHTGILSVSALHPHSQLNKFAAVYPVGVFLSLSGIIALLLFMLLKRKFKKFGLGLLGFIFLILLVNIVLFFQQYPKYITINYNQIIFDIKNHISFFVVMICIYCYHNWNRLKK